MSDHADVARQSNRRFANAALDVGIEILLPIAGQVDHHAPAPIFSVSRVTGTSRRCNRPSPAPISTFNSRGIELLKRRFQSLCETPKCGESSILSDVDLTDARCDVVIDSRGAVRFGETEVGFQRAARTAIDGQRSGRRLNRSVDRVRALKIDMLALVLHARTRNLGRARTRECETAG